MQTWKFLYTKESSYLKATNKNGSLKRGKSHYVTTDGKDYADCLSKARTEGGFRDAQLIGSRRTDT